MTVQQKRLVLLQEELKKNGVDAFIQPTNDQFMSEYPPASAQRLEWVSGFSGSAGTGLFLQQPTIGASAVMFVDGRYTLQAAQEVDITAYSVVNSADQSIAQWLLKNIPAGGVLAYDPWLYAQSQIKRLEKALEATAWRLQAVEKNPLDKVWKDRPDMPAEPIVAHPMAYAGQSAANKCEQLAEEIAGKGADAAILTLPDGINWLLNIRGADIPFNPLALCFAMVEASGKVQLFLNGHSVEAGALDEIVEIQPIDDLYAHPEQYLSNYTSLLIDPQHAASWWFAQCDRLGIRVVEEADVTLLPKACKNPVEVDGIRTAHQRDGVALTRFLEWLDGECAARAVSEMEAVERLEAFRQEIGGELYKGASFATISGAGPNGAIVHYRVSEQSNRTIGDGELYLVDSGGQYPDGTTDVTRTVVRGTPADEMKDHFTRVLKGHIALAMAVFPEGTTGAQLDVLARQYLWDKGLNYDHGTGHGVGAYLCVHEGPQGISSRANTVALQAGMILSNEPGYYKTGEYGIRIENLVVVVEHRMSEGRRYLAFETLTLAPIDERLIDDALLTDKERGWLTRYHQRVAENMKEIM